MGKLVTLSSEYTEFSANSLAESLKNGLEKVPESSSLTSNTFDKIRSSNPIRMSKLRFSRTSVQVLSPSDGLFKIIIHESSDNESLESYPEVEVGRNSSQKQAADISPLEHTLVQEQGAISTSEATNWRKSSDTVSSKSCYSTLSLDSLHSIATSNDVFAAPTVFSAPHVPFSKIASSIENAHPPVLTASTSLAQRRRFKGEPIIVPRSTSLLLRSRSSSFGSRPVSAFVTTMSQLWSSSPKTTSFVDPFQVPPQIQDHYDQTDPFRTTSASHYTLHVEDGSYPYGVQDNLYNFEVYNALAEQKPDFFKKLSQRGRLLALPSSPSPHSIGTKIYEVSMSDISGIPGLLNDFNTPQKPNVDANSNQGQSSTPASIDWPKWDPETAFFPSPKIWLTPPSAPPSPLRQIMERESPSAHHNSREFHHHLQASSTPAKLVKPSLRPLILPLHIVNSAPTIPPEGRKSPFAHKLDAGEFVSSLPSLPLTRSRSLVQDHPLPTINERYSEISITESIYDTSQSLSSEGSQSESVTSSDSGVSRAMLDILFLLDGTTPVAEEVLDVNGNGEASTTGSEAEVVELVEDFTFAI